MGGEYYPLALTVAGSDSGGGAGIQADLRTFSAFGVYGSSALTAVTAQNPNRVYRVDALPVEAVREQLRAVREAFSVGALKTGMLCDVGIVRVVAEELRKFKCPVVVDPVMVSTSGTRLLSEDAVSVLKDELLPLADWLTPNLREAELLTGRAIGNMEEMAAAGRECAERWKCGCVIKGGHAVASGGLVTDVVAYNGKVLALSSPEVAGTRASHGTGCTLSAALCACLALGFSWKESLRAAKGFVYGSLVEEVELGNGVVAMYPPQESYIGEIELKRIDN